MAESFGHTLKTALSSLEDFDTRVHAQTAALLRDCGLTCGDIITKLLEKRAVECRELRGGTNNVVAGFSRACGSVLSGIQSMRG